MKESSPDFQDCFFVTNQFPFAETFPLGGRWPEGPDEGNCNRTKNPSSVKNRFRSADFCQLLPREKLLPSLRNSWKIPIWALLLGVEWPFYYPERDKNRCG